MQRENSGKQYTNLFIVVISSSGNEWLYFLFIYCSKKNLRQFTNSQRQIDSKISEKEQAKRDVGNKIQTGATY